MTHVLYFSGSYNSGGQAGPGQGVPGHHQPHPAAPQSHGQLAGAPGLQGAPNNSSNLAPHSKPPSGHSGAQPPGNTNSISRTVIIFRINTEH